MAVSLPPYDAQHLHLDAVLRNAGSHSKTPTSDFQADSKLI